MMKRLLRDLKSQKGWLIAAVLLVAIGAGTYSSIRSGYDSAIRCLDKSEKELRSSIKRILTVSENKV